MHSGVRMPLHIDIAQPGVLHPGSPLPIPAVYDMLNKSAIYSFYWVHFTKSLSVELGFHGLEFIFEI